MKKIIFFCMVALLSCQLIFASKSAVEPKDKIVGFDIGLATGIPFYGSSYVTNTNDRVNDGDFYRFIIGASADLNFKLGDPIKFMVGADVLFDFIWKGNDYSNHIDYAFFTGLKFYPGIGGLNGSIAYCLGCRNDFANNEVEDSITHSSAWGNGFRLGIEYDFKYGSNHKCLPSIGTYYRCMPRGENEWDNILAAYFALSF